MKQHTHLLSPTILTDADFAHKSVDELKEVLKEKDCRNIAITGTYGSGKSSIIRTLQNEVDGEYKFVNISLSTLDTKVQDIESSIVQQLLYKTDSSQSGQYRYKKPYVIHEDQLRCWVKRITILIISICVAFEPEWLRIEGLYSVYGLLEYNLGYWINIIADIVSLIYIIYFIVLLLYHVIKRIHCYAIKRLDIYNTSIEFSEKASVFNKHLDEIECFFRATMANVVVFEDLDRINNPQSLFLKLRELNAIINDSAEIKKEHTVKFIYAIKDDIFRGEERTKYFDYIVSAIPVVDANNSADYLIKQYGHDDSYNISQRQWQELGSYIHGMRELHNVVNEFLQYKALVGKSLEDHKLFAITIYKNKYPLDYSLLHSKSGILYYTISAKKDFSDKATQAMVEKYHSFENNIVMLRTQLNAIRNNYIQHLKVSYNIDGLVINSKEYTLDQIRDTDELFRAFMENAVDQYVANKTSKFYDLDFTEIDSVLNDGNGHIERLRALESEIPQTIAEQSKLEHQIISLANSSLANIISNIKDGEVALGIIQDKYKVCYQLGKNDALSTEAIAQCKMILFLLRNGYVDENYPQYISYFYPGSLTDNDNKYLQSITLGIAVGYDYKLDDVAGVIDRMVTEYYDSETALNFNIVDYLSANSDYYAFLDRILSNVRITPKFMLEYDKVSANSKALFEYILTKHDWFLDVAFNNDNVELQDELIVLFFKYCPIQIVGKYKKHFERLNDLYSVIFNNLVLLDIDRVCQLLRNLNLKFTRVYNGDAENTALLYNFVLDNSLYAINIDNIKTILAGGFSTKTITSIVHNTNQNVYANLWAHLDGIYKLIPETSVEEEEDAIKFMLNDSRIPSDFKKQYIEKQRCIVQDLNRVNLEVESILYSTDHIAVLWRNIFDSFSHNNGQIADYLLEFIIRNYNELKDQKIEYDKEDIVSNIFDLLFATNKLPENVYATLLPEFSLVFSSDTDLSELSIERMRVIIENSKFAFSDDSLELVQEYFSDELLADFIINNIDEYISSSTIVSNEVYWRILSSSNVSSEQKVRLLENVSEIDDDSYAPNFANAICQCYLDIPFTAEHNTSLILVAINYCNIWDLQIRSINRINQVLSYNKTQETQMLQALGGEYLKLNTFYGAASFDINDANRELLDYLKTHRHYVSDYKEKDNQFRVSFLCK